MSCLSIPFGIIVSFLVSSILPRIQSDQMASYICSYNLLLYL
uniref:Uncharacterized protein n=1 Tax=Arundo donax TaxID=35708 RepID=A0A0A9C212_ARUDO